MKIFAPLYFLLPMVLFGQTILNPGDMMIVGLENNVEVCLPGSNNMDVLYFVSSKEIVTGTSIDLTDNGWERLYANYWGTTEGVYRCTLTGPNIPAGTVFSLGFTNNFSSIQAFNPNWNIQNLNSVISSINFNNNGDQLFIMQGGTWSIGASVHQGSYNGRLIYGFTNRNSWTAADNTSASNLPQALICFNTKIATGSASYIFYNGSMSEVPPLEWLQRLNNLANWQVVANCTDFSQAFNLSSIDFATDQITLSPITQSLCLNETPQTLFCSSQYDQVTYQWYVNDQNSTTGSTLIAGANQSQFTPTQLQEGIHYFYCEIMVNGCSQYSEIISVIVNSLPDTTNIIPN